FAGLAKSPIKGPKGNVEYLSYFMYSENINKAGNISEIIERVVNDEEYSYCCKTSC
ncbi:MAG: TlyA family rRNA (cytidine-2'-O)-methyltransferase, partial [Flexistipes sinusarabici]